jgi:hypothetical protein
MRIRGGLTCWRRAPAASRNGPVKCSASSVATLKDEVQECARPYSEVPGPKPLPVVGNTWRFLPFIGKVKVAFPSRN